MYYFLGVFLFVQIVFYLYGLYSMRRKRNALICSYIEHGDTICINKVMLRLRQINSPQTVFKLVVTEYPFTLNNLCTLIEYELAQNTAPDVVEKFKNGLSYDTVRFVAEKHLLVLNSDGSLCQVSSHILDENEIPISMIEQRKIDQIEYLTA